MSLRTIFCYVLIFMVAFTLGSRWNQINGKDRYKEGFIDGIETQLLK